MTRWRLTIEFDGGPFMGWQRQDPIATLAAEHAADDWQPRFSSIGRRYEYRILNRRPPPAVERGKVWHIATPLDVDAMAEGAALLVGRHDFTTFRSIQCQSKSPVKTLDRLDVTRDGDEIRFEAAARSFLHHQVRSMIGCLAMVGRGQWAPADIKAALDARDRAALGLNAPPHGLYFVQANYP